MMLRVRVCRCAPGDDGGATQLCKLWRRCRRVMRRQAAPRHLKDTQLRVNGPVHLESHLFCLYKEVT